MKPSFLQQVEPTRVELLGGVAELRFTLHAAAAIEQEFDVPSYLTIVYEALGLDPEGHKLDSVMPLERQARLVAILMRECGQDATVDDLMTMHMDDFTRLAMGAVTVIFYKSPRGKGKKKSLTET